MAAGVLGVLGYQPRYMETAGGRFWGFWGRNPKGILELKIYISFNFQLLELRGQNPQNPNAPTTVVLGITAAHPYRRGTPTPIGCCAVRYTPSACAGYRPALSVTNNNTNIKPPDCDTITPGMQRSTHAMHHRPMPSPANLSGNLSGLDYRTTVGRTMRARWDALTTELGGADALTYSERSLAERCLWLEYWLAQQEQALASGGDFDARGWLQACETLQTTLAKLPRPTNKGTAA